MPATQRMELIKAQNYVKYSKHTDCIGLHPSIMITTWNGRPAQSRGTTGLLSLSAHKLHNFTPFTPFTLCM